MELNEYQKRAMTTCMESCDNFSYMFLNLVGEVGEFASKVAKAIRKKELAIGGRIPTKRNILTLREIKGFDILAFDTELKKEGRCSVKVADLSEFWRGQKNIVLCDPNILACKDWKELLQQLIDSKAKVDFNQGLDIRLMTEEKAEMLNQIRTKEIHFAWDRYQDKDVILPKFKMYAKKAGLNSKKHSTIVFTLVNFDTTIEQDLERIYTLRDLGYWAYVMIYDKEHCKPIYKRLQRWCNMRAVFASTPRFEDYGKENNTNDSQQLRLW